MMKVATALMLCAVLLLAVNSAWAVFYEIPYDWIEINPAYPGALPGTNSGIVNDDHNVGPFDLGFTFSFYGTDFTSIRLCSNGFASFTSTATTYSNAAIPSSANPNDLVAPYWDDMNPSGTNYGEVFYYADPAGEFFVAEWDSMAHFGSTIVGEYYTFELILYPDGTIDYQYKAIEPGNMTPFPSATVGVENSSGTIGEQCTFNGSGPLEPTAGMGIHIEIDFATPVTLSSFTAAIEEEEMVLRWETASELDCYGWVVQRDGEDISEVIPGYGTTVEPHEYSYVDGSAQAGETYSYRLKQIDIGGETTFSDPITMTMEAMVVEYGLQGNFPNPFNPQTMLRYSLREAGEVTLIVYDVNGRPVATVVDGWRDVGYHEATFDGTNLASGVYVYDLKVNDFSATGKMVLLK
jgi:hypothetical protein